MRKIEYFPFVDGLRAIAVVLVIFYHTRMPGLSGGFIGVDVFFVISGYLITQIIVVSLDNGEFRILDFLESRARRLLPALYIMLIILLFAGYIILVPRELEQFSDSMVHTGLFNSNYYFYEHSGYFDTAASRQPLLHTWSLAVEAQFYLIWPAIVWFGYRVLADKLLLVLAVIAIVSFFYSELIIDANPNAAFYLLPSRAWELAAGGILGLIHLKGVALGRFDRILSILVWH